MENQQTISIDENFGSENGKAIILNGEVDFLTFDEQGNIFALGVSAHIVAMGTGCNFFA